MEDVYADATFTPLTAKGCWYLCVVCIISGAAITKYFPIVELRPSLDDVWLPWYLQFTANFSLTGIFFELAFRFSASMRSDFGDPALYASRLKLNALTVLLFTIVFTVYQAMAINQHPVHRSWISEYYGGHQAVYSLRYLEWGTVAPLFLLVLGHHDPIRDSRALNRLAASGVLTGVYTWTSWLGLVVKDINVAWAMICLAWVCYTFASAEQCAFAYYVRSEGRGGVTKCWCTLAFTFLMGVDGVVYMMGAFGTIDPVLEQKVYSCVDVIIKLANVLVLWLVRQIDDIHILQELRNEATTLAEDTQRLISSANVPIFRVDLECRIVQWNTKMEQLTGITEEKVLGDSFLDFLGGNNKSEGEAMVNAAFGGEKAPSAELVLTPPEYCVDSAKEATMVLSSVPTRNKQGSVVGATCMGYDLTEITAIREAEQRKQRFMAIVSHELRSPLHGIIGLTEGLSSSEQDTGRMKQLNMVKNCASRLLDLVVNIMDLSSMGSKDWKNQKTKRKLSRDPVEVNKIIEEVVLLVRSATDKQGHALLKPGVKLLNNIPTTLPIIEADAYKCTQMFQNLLTNACKFTKQGKIEIQANVDASRQFVQVRISDTGKGISKEARERIWRPFEQEEQTETREYEGIGLGLSIVKEVVDRHRGGIHLESEVGVGTAFTVTLPTTMQEEGGETESLESRSAQSTQGAPPVPLPPSPPVQPDTPPTPRTVTPRVAMEAPTLSQPSTPTTLVKSRPEVPHLAMREKSTKDRRPVILSVDDDAVNQAVIEQALSDEYEIRFAMNGAEALEYFDTHSCLPDCMLLDVMMPGMSGFEVCKDIREKLQISVSVLPVLMLSARSPIDSSVIKGLASGCNDYISKPFQKEVLRARVRTALQIKRLHSTELEYARHTELLYSIMPPHVIERLQAGETMIAESHESVTILFSDIVGWTNIAESLTTSQVVVLLNDLFSAFDDRTGPHGVFKVETIGDAYMCAAGHDGSKDHADRIVRFAFAMIEATSTVRLPVTGIRLAIRVGVHTGPAYTGVVGRKVPRYCFFGDTVNVSSRMESHGTPGCIHISGSTYDVLDGNIVRESQAEILTSTVEIKGKGRMQTHLIVPKGASARRPERRVSKTYSEVPETAAVEAQLRQELQEAQEAKGKYTSEVRELEARHRSELEVARNKLLEQAGELEAARGRAVSLESKHGELQVEARRARSELDAARQHAGELERARALAVERERNVERERSATVETPRLRVGEGQWYNDAALSNNDADIQALKPALETPRLRMVSGDRDSEASRAEHLPLIMLEKQLRHLTLEVKLKDKRIAELRSQLQAIRLDNDAKDDEMQHALLDLRS